MMDVRLYLKLYFNAEAWKKRLFTQRMKSIYDLDCRRLDKKIKIIILDVDDTLRGHLDVMPKKTIEFLKQLDVKGVRMALFSNMTLQQRKDLKMLLKGVKVVYGRFTNKPSPKGYFDLFSREKVKPENVMVIGDRIGTDMFGAYLAGITERILVEPYSIVFGALKAPMYIRVLRKIERWLFS
ncbi:HAD hydrolase-like protein [Candidatus Woesearchaeota archaeon]|nr:HAD hydrolase-like protein [Candidatus Woesearchaeota archaeon]